MHFMSATVSRCRRAYRCADMATAMAESSTLTRLASDRNRPARSADARICGLASAIELSRSPFCLWVASQAPNCSTAGGAPANSSARLTRLPGWTSRVAGRSARLIISVADRSAKPLPWSGR